MEQKHKYARGINNSVHPKPCLNKTYELNSNDFDGPIKTVKKTSTEPNKGRKKKCSSKLNYLQVLFWNCQGPGSHNQYLSCLHL